MRLKQFYSNNEIITDLYTTGSEWMTTDNVEYIGLYHKYTTGEVYTQPTWNKQLSKQLIEYRQTNTSIDTFNKISNINLNYNSFRTHNVNITKKDIAAGYIQRYFFKKANENKFYEVNEDTYQQYRKQQIDNNLYVAISLKWYITGEMSDSFKGAIQLLGVKTKNEQSIFNAEKVLNNLSKYLTNPIEYYVDTDVIVPADINGLDS